MRNSVPKPAVVLGTATLTAAPSLAGARRALPVDVGIGVGEDGFFYWHGRRAEDGGLVPQRGNWQSHTGWEWLRVSDVLPPVAIYVEK